MPIEARRPGRSASVAIGVIACVVFAAGVGLVVPRLGASNPGPGAWWGAVLVVTGAVAACWAGLRVLRSVRRRWWLVVVPGFVVVAYLALWTVGQGVAASFPAHADLGSRTPADAGLAARSVVLRTGDRVELAGWWVPGGNGAAVVLLHGAGSTRTAVIDQAKVLSSGGYGVLLVDARGHGASKGRAMDFGWYGEQDVAAAVDYLVRQPSVRPDRIGVVGLSMGGEEAIGAAGSDPRIRAVVAEGATNRVAADKGYLAAYGVRGHLQEGIDWLTYAVADVLTDAPKPVALRASVARTQADGTPTPILLITAGDVPTEKLAAAYLSEAAPGAVEVWSVSGATHTRGLKVDPAGWRLRVLGFLDRALGAR